MLAAAILVNITVIIININTNILMNVSIRYFEKSVFWKLQDNVSKMSMLLLRGASSALSLGIK